MAVARTLSEQSMVLLQNNGSLLPLDAKKVKKIVLVGTDALAPTTSGTGSGHVDYSVRRSLGLRLHGRFGSTLRIFACFLF